MYLEYDSKLKTYGIRLGDSGRRRIRVFIPYVDDIPDDKILRNVSVLSKNGRIFLGSEKNPHDARYLIALDTEGAYSRYNGTGTYKILTEDLVQVLVSGQKAYGDAGSLGTQKQDLMLVKPGALIKILPSGRRHHLKDHYMVIVRQDNILVMDPDEYKTYSAMIEQGEFQEL